MTTTPASGPDRRQVLGGALLASGVVAAGFGAGRLGRGTEQSRPTAPDGVSQGGADGAIGRAQVPFTSEDQHGRHQAGVLTPAPAHLVIAAFDLAPKATKDQAKALLRMWSGNIVRLTQGRGTLADAEPELAAEPASLTITLGLGPAFFDKTGTIAQRPPWCAALPAFPTIDKLQPAWKQSDLVLQICADDAVTVAHALRVMTKDARGIATPVWQQRGFRRSAGSAPGETMRNLLGQVDGTRNPPEMDRPELVWAGQNTGWMRGGTGMVVRRIQMHLEKWEEADRPLRDKIMGRRMSDGAPLTGQQETDEPDLEATDAIGAPIIARGAHIRRARDTDAMHRFLRRPYNYDDPAPAGHLENAGLVFIAFAADVAAQFTPIQRRLAENDLLNTWTTPIGSAVYAIPPGALPGGYLGEGLLG